MLKLTKDKQTDKKQTGQKQYAPNDSIRGLKKFHLHIASNLAVNKLIFGLYI